MDENSRHHASAFCLIDVNAKIDKEKLHVYNSIIMIKVNICVVITMIWTLLLTSSSTIGDSVLKSDGTWRVGLTERVRRVRTDRQIRWDELGRVGFKRVRLWSILGSWVDGMGRVRWRTEWIEFDFFGSLIFFSKFKNYSNKF
jgi:hypothetical protein